MLAGFERRDAHLAMQMVRHDDVDRLDRPVVEERAKIAMDRGLRETVHGRRRPCVSLSQDIAASSAPGTFAIASA